MKKQLIAVAVSAAVAAPAMAQNVTISGMVKPGIDVTKRTDQNGQTEVSDQSSRFIIAGSEDLGGGLRASFQIDTRLALDNATGQQGSVTNANVAGTRTATEIGNGNSFMGITGSFGELRVGKHDLHYNEMGALIDGATNSAGNLQASAAAGLLSQVTRDNNTSLVVALTTRTPNLIMYNTPTMSGWRFGAAYSSSIGRQVVDLAQVVDTRDGAGGASNAAKTNGGNALNLTARWAGGPFSVVGSYWTAKSENRTQAADIDQKAYVLGGRYTIGNSRLSAVYNDSSVKTIAGVKTQRTGFGVSIDHNMSSSVILHATYAAVGNVEIDNVNTANTGADHITLGASYILSKRTSTGFYWTKLDNKTRAGYSLFNSSLGAVNPGDTSTSAYFGLRHTF